MPETMMHSGDPFVAIMKKQEPKPWKSPPGPRWD